LIGRTDIVALGATFGILALPPKKHGVSKTWKVPWGGGVGVLCIRCRAVNTMDICQEL
jgi:hypothetical protein